MIKMSQKALALEAYEELTMTHGALTTDLGWRTLRTTGVTLLKEGDELPSSIDAFIDSNVEQLKHQIQHSQLSFPVFVRACPLNPRPGVLESSMADNWDEFTTVATRIITTMMSPDPSDKPMYDTGLIDPYGTVIVQPYIDADASAVVSPNHYIMMGRDNDGVTAGKDGIIVTIPIQECSHTKNDMKRLNIDPQLIELEFVSELSHKDTGVRGAMRQKYQPVQDTRLVQLRGCEGPRPIGTPPKGVTISGTFHGAERINIKHIHLVSDNTDEQLDLMEQALREGMPDGSVVLHPNGSHLSHHAGQCFKYGVPYIASAVPQVGEQWTQAQLGWVVLDNEGTYEPQAYDPLDYSDEFIEGFKRGFTNFARQHGWLSNHFHQYTGGPINDPAECAMYAGGYVAWLINATLSVGLGEIRHLPTTTRNATALPLATIASIYGVDAWKKVTQRKHHLSDSRTHYYMMIEEMPVTLDSCISMLEFAMKCYQLEWNAGYGGKKYYESCQNAHGLAQAMKSLLTTQGDEQFKEMIFHANLTEHNVHNNDFFFSKFISKTALNWGTDPRLVTITPKSFFSIYYAARDIMESTERDTLDALPILQLAKGITKKSMRETPLSQRDDSIGHAMLYLNEMQRHPMGLFRNHESKNFIPCGVQDCIVCGQWDTEVKESITPTLVPIPASHDAPFPLADKTPIQSAQLQWLKVLSKQLNDGELTATEMTGEKGNGIAKAMAGIFAEGYHHDMQKYVSNIIASFGTEQLLLLSNKKNGEKEE